MPDPGALVVRTVAALVAAMLISIVARRKRLLDGGGAIAAVIVGTTLVVTGGWWAGILLVGFFIASSLLSISGGDRPSRTWQQVAANGAPATLFATLGYLFESSSLLIASAAAIAASTADTWATEIGQRSGAVPRSVTNFRPVPIGTSGAVSGPGTVANIGGAAFIALLAVAFSPLAATTLAAGPSDLLVLSLTGAMGSAVDSVLGATVQARYQCATCGALSEDRRDPQHTFALASGVGWVTNDGVNLASGTLAGMLALLIAA